METKSPIIDDIIRVAALGSNVHPDIIHEMVSIRGDYYTEQYIHISERQSSKEYCLTNSIPLDFNRLAISSSPLEIKQPQLKVFKALKL